MKQYMELKEIIMKKWLITMVVVASLVSCNFDKKHNQLHKQQFDEGMTEFHELFDYFFMTPR